MVGPGAYVPAPTEGIVDLEDFPMPQLVVYSRHHAYTPCSRCDHRSLSPHMRATHLPARLPNPTDPQTFADSKLDLSERQHHAEMYVLHRDLLRLRQTDAVFRPQRPGSMDGAVLGPEAFVLRFFGVYSDDRLLVVNLGSDLHLDPAPEPLLAPPEVWTGPSCAPVRTHATAGMA